MANTDVSSRVLGEQDEWDGGEHEDVEDDDGYLEKLAKQARSYQWKGGEDTHDADDDDDDDDYDAFFGTSGYDDDMSTPLDSVDAFATFKDVMVALQGADPARAQAMAAGLAPEAMTTVNELMAYAEVRRVEIVQEAQAKMKVRTREGARVLQPSQSQVAVPVGASAVHGCA